MTRVGQRERHTQERIVALFKEKLGYEYLGDWSTRADNRNIEPALLQSWLEKRGEEKGAISRALHHLEREAGDTSKSLFERNRGVYGLLRYGVKVKTEHGENTRTVWLIDWKHPAKNHFALAEEVTVLSGDPRGHEKRPDLVLYVNGLALAVLELKRGKVSVAEGIRQNLANQEKTFIEPFFSTIQLLMAGNETEGLRYGAIETPEKYYLAWKEEAGAVAGLDNPLDLSLAQLCRQERLLELIHDFIVFDAGRKKFCRHNQYFGVRAAQAKIRKREGGIIWHTQGSGKSLTMVWLAKWIRENVQDSRVLIITDRTELDEQIEKVFKGVNEDIYRTASGADLIASLNTAAPWLLCSLVHKFRGRDGGQNQSDYASFAEELRKALPKNFRPKGDLVVFVDECHRTQSGDLHKAMKAILPGAIFIGFTGTPLLKADKARSIEVFGGYIHTYKFDEAVRDKVVLDLRYEARNIDQKLTSQPKIDEWFEKKTLDLTDHARIQLKKLWGTMQKVLSCQTRLEKIVADVVLDMNTRPRLLDGQGNAMLVSGSIYEGCKFYELFSKTELKGKCAIITSYRPNVAHIKGEFTGDGDTDNLRKYEIYKQMLAEWFNEDPATAINKADLFETQVKKKFIEEPGQMKLLIVVDKLLTGFDAPPATYLYIDKQMRDHGLFQAICRVNRLDGDDKEYGHIVDYKDLFKSLEGAVTDYTSGALDGFDRADVAGLLDDRVTRARERLEEALEALRALCEPVEPPRDNLSFYRYFSSKEPGNQEQLKATEPRRLALYKMTPALVRAYAAIASEMAEAGYAPDEAAAIRKEVVFYEDLRNEVRLHSGDAIDLKRYEPAMRHLIDTYIQADEARPLSNLDDLSLVQVLVGKGSAAAIAALPKNIQNNREAVAETIENNVRRIITDETPVNPRYYEKMSELLFALVEQRRAEVLDYAEYLEKIVALARQVQNGPGAVGYPPSLDTPGKKALFDNLGKDEHLALRVDEAVRGAGQDDWRQNAMKTKKVMLAIRSVMGGDLQTLDNLLELVKNNHEY